MANAPDLPDPVAASIVELRASIDDGARSSRQIVQAALDRIEALDRQGPALRAVVELDREALGRADQLDQEARDGRTRGPLHGIPILLKDNIAVRGMENTTGSLALMGARPVEDAFLVRCLRDAGAIILGKTNLGEWANFRSTGSTSGWSARGGQTLNPHQLDRNPSGSSSGSGVAAAAGYVPVTLGTETNGSIVSPANASGIVGIKPTVGLTSRMGVIPISHNQDTIGPMARNVADAAMVLSVIARPDSEDPAVAQQGTNADGATYPTRPDSLPDAFDYAGSDVLNAEGLRDATIGVWRPRKSYSNAVDAVFDESLAAMRDAGARLVDGIVLDPASSEIDMEASLKVLLSEIGPGVAAYIDRYVDSSFPIRNLRDVIAFNRNHEADELRWFGQNLLEWAVERPGIDDSAYIEAVKHSQRRGRELGIDAMLQTHGLDAIVAPSGPPATRIDLVNGDHILGSSSTPAAIAGYPIVTVPAGSRFGLPLNISFIGGAFTEATLIRLAYAFEQKTLARIDPTMHEAGITPPSQP